MLTKSAYNFKIVSKKCKQNEQIPMLNGWSINELVFIYGFSQIPKGFDHLFADYIWLLSSRIVTNGEYDRYLLRPIPPLFQLLCDRLQLDAIGELLVGFSLVMISVTNCNVIITPLSIVLLSQLLLVQSSIHL